MTLIEITVSFEISFSIITIKERMFFTFIFKENYSGKQINA